MGGAYDGAPRAAREGRDQRIEIRRIDTRHVAQHDHRAVGICRQRPDTGLE
jgi:hypothetical protein